VAQDSNPTADVAIWRVVAVASLGPLMTNLDATAVNVALSAMGHSFDAPVPTIQWVSTAYLLALALALPVTGWLVDRFGVRLVYVACFCGFSLA
jgi:MFS family permease